MTAESQPARLRWGYSLVMLVVYLAVFKLWQPFPRGGAALFGLLAAFGLSAGALLVRRTGYFVNDYDAWFHGIVILDIVLEALLVPAHVGNSFYGCAAAFALVIGGYRFSAWRERRRISAKEPTVAEKTSDQKGQS